MKHLDHILNAQFHFILLTCSIYVFVFSLTQMFDFLSVYMVLNKLLSMFVRLLACSLPGWRGPTFSRRMSLLEVCKIVNKKFKGYLWKCRGARNTHIVLTWTHACLKIDTFDEFIIWNLDSSNVHIHSHNHTISHNIILSHTDKT